MGHIAVIIGTRPEAIKMSPIILHARERGLRCTVIGTGQHRELFAAAMDAFLITPDISLSMKCNGKLPNTYASILKALHTPLSKLSPDCVLVHGDTASTFAAALCGYLQGLTIGHVEAGLRSHSPREPWPEEANRKLTGVIADYHFCPTQIAADNLLAESVAANSVYVVGNTVIDALLLTIEKIKTNKTLRTSLDEKFKFIHKEKKLILVTVHRRENFGENLHNICKALRALSQREDLEIVLPVHPNPMVKHQITEALESLQNCHVIQPVDYPSFVYLMSRATLILSDSGGIQEEAPTMNIPVLVLREKTERPEALEANRNILVGTRCDNIVKHATLILEADITHSSKKNPFGDGKAADRILDKLSDAGVFHK